MLKKKATYKGIELIEEIQKAAIRAFSKYILINYNIKNKDTDYFSISLFFIIIFFKTIYIKVNPRGISGIILVIYNICSLTIKT